MQLRRVFIGTAVLFGLSVWSWSRGDGPQAQAATADPVRTATAADPDSGNYDEAQRRFLRNQSTHWRQVMIAR